MINFATFFTHQSASAVIYLNNLGSLTNDQQGVLDWHTTLQTTMIGLMSDNIHTSNKRVDFIAAYPMIMAARNANYRTDINAVHFLIKDFIKEFVMLDLSGTSFMDLKYTVHNALYDYSNPDIKDYMDAKDIADLDSKFTFLIQLRGNTHFDEYTQDDEVSIFLNLGDLCPPN